MSKTRKFLLALLIWLDARIQDRKSRRINQHTNQTANQKLFGVTHRGRDCETKAFLENGRVWISDGDGGWLRCAPGIEGYFSPDNTSADAD